MLLRTGKGGRTSGKWIEDTLTYSSINPSKILCQLIDQSSWGSMNKWKTLSATGAVLVSYTEPLKILWELLFGSKEGSVIRAEYWRKDGTENLF